MPTPLVVAALFLAGTPGSSWFAVLEALQNADYVLTTSGTAPPGPAPLGIGTVAGSLSKCGGTQTEGQVEQQQQRHQAAAHPLLADVDSESVQAAIRRLFDARGLQVSRFCWRIMQVELGDSQHVEWR